MRWQFRFSLKALLLLMAAVAFAILVALDGDQWLANYRDWSSARPARFYPIGVEWSSPERCFVFSSEDKFYRLRVASPDPAIGMKRLEIEEREDRPPGTLRAWSPRDSRALIATGRKDGADWKWWNWRTGDTQSLKFLSRSTVATLFPGGNGITLVSNGDWLVLAEDGTELSRRPVAPRGVGANDLQFSPDGRYLAVVNRDGTCYFLTAPEFPRNRR